MGDIEQHFLRKSLKFRVTNLPIKFLKPASAHLQKQTAEDHAHLGRDPEIPASLWLRCGGRVPSRAHAEAAFPPEGPATPWYSIE